MTYLSSPQLLNLQNEYQCLALRSLLREKDRKLLLLATGAITQAQHSQSIQDDA